MWTWRAVENDLPPDKLIELLNQKMRRLEGELKDLIIIASTAKRASLTIPHGVAPTAPVNGDVWSTTTTLNFRLNGVTKTVTLT